MSVRWFVGPSDDGIEPVAQGQYVVSDTRCPASYVGDCR